MHIDLTLIDFLLVAPALSLFVFSCIPLLIKVVRGNQEQNSFATLIYAYVGLVVAAGFAISTLGSERAAFSGALVFDGISSFTTLVVLLITGVALTFARDNRATNSRQFSESMFLTMNAAAGMLTVAWSNDLIVTFVGLELFSLCLYVLI